MYLVSILSSLFLVILPTRTFSQIPENSRSRTAINDNEDTLSTELEDNDLILGSEIFIRIFKNVRELELWVENGDGEFDLFKTYNICDYSGELGPKTRQGDMQSPEGFYFVNAARFNPWSDFHLSFNLGYPNQFDRFHGYTGDYLMIHGSCVSIGCYAMTDPVIEELYTIASKAIESGQPFFRVHIFPFKMTSTNMESYADNEWFEFWENLKEGYEWFEENKTPPNVTINNGRYSFN